MYARTFCFLLALHAWSVRASNATDMSNPPRYPTEVFFGVSTVKIGSIDEVVGQFRFDFYFFYAWEDYRQDERIIDLDTDTFRPDPEL